MSSEMIFLLLLAFFAGMGVVFVLRTNEANKERWRREKERWQQEELQKKRISKLRQEGKWNP
jgi:hypothetical protein